MDEVERAALSAKVREEWDAARAIDGRTVASKREKASRFEALVAALNAYWKPMAGDAAIDVAFAAAVCRYEDKAHHYRQMAEDQEGSGRG